MTNRWYLLFASFSILSLPSYGSAYQGFRGFKNPLAAVRSENSDLSIPKKPSQKPEWKRSLVVYFSLPF
jgi:hypothetical protein